MAKSMSIKPVYNQTYERVRNQVANALFEAVIENSPNKVFGKSIYHNVAKNLKITEPKLRDTIWNKDFRLSTVVRICESAGLEPYLILRPILPPMPARKEK